MGKRAVVLVFSLLVVLVLSIMVFAFFSKSLNENNLVKRYVASKRAFWLAEAGVAQGINNLPSLGLVTSTIGGSNYRYSAQPSLLSAGYYQIDSTGTVTLPDGAVVNESVSAVAKTGTTDPSKFPYAIETTTELEIKGSVSINPSDSQREYATLNFADLFGYSKTDLKSNATHLYTPTNFAAPVDGITWVDVPAGDTLTVAGNLVGSGILIVSGDTHFSGTVDFNGIIYVIGKLTMTGTVTTSGAVLAESSTTVDTILKGNVTLNYSVSDITDALNAIALLKVDIVSWKKS